MHAAVRVAMKYYHRQGHVCVYMCAIHTYGNAIRSQMTDEVGFFILLDLQCRVLQIYLHCKIGSQGVA